MSGVTTVRITGGLTDGLNPYPIITGPPLQGSGELVYGTTIDGGYNNCGIIYSCDLSGGNYKILHRFSRDMLVLNVDETSQRDGSTPSGPLTMVNRALYGTTRNGGEGSDGGTLFRLDSTGYRIIANFGTSSCPISVPSGSPTLHNGILYGAVSDDTGNSGYGGIYTYNTNTSVFNYVNFGDITDASGARGPTGALYVDSSANIYGTGGSGGLFKLSRSGETWTHTTLWNAPTIANFSQNIVADSSNNLYFLAIIGGAADLMKYNFSTVSVKKTLIGGFNNDRYSIYYRDRKIYFNSGATIANYNIDTDITGFSNLSATLTDFYLYNNTMAYISTAVSIVSRNITNTAETSVHLFAGTNESQLVHDTIFVGSTMYLLTSNGLASCSIDGSNYTVLDTSAGNYGQTCLFSQTISVSQPLDGSGGTTIIFFSIGKQLFSLNTTTRAITPITHSLDLSGYVAPFVGLIYADSNIYGVLYNNTTSSNHLIKVNTSNNLGSVIRIFDPVVTIGPLIINTVPNGPTKIYGTTFVVNPSTGVPSGTIFNINLADSTYVTTHTTDKNLNGIVVGLPENRIFGCTTDGIIFSADISGGPLTELVSDNDANLTYNAVKYNNGYLYYAAGRSIYRADIGGISNQSIYDLPAVLYNSGEPPYNNPFERFQLNTNSISIQTGPVILNLPVTFNGPPPIPGETPFPTTIHVFGSSPTSGSNPRCTIDIAGKLYGVCTAGGTNGQGTLFRVRPSGQFFEDNLINFNGGSPSSDIIRDESYIYGAQSNTLTKTSKIFQYDINNNRSWTLFDNSGMTITNLLQGSSNLYGAFTNTDSSCVIFRTPKINFVNNSYTVLRTFPSPSVLRCLAVQDGVLYGVVAENVDNLAVPANSKLFKMNVDGTGYTDGKTFTGADLQGNRIINLTVAAGYVYGFSSRGGLNNRGTIFRCNLDVTTGYTVLHIFEPLTGYPLGIEKPLTIVNGTIYGVCALGGPGIGDGNGSNGGGVIFSLKDSTMDEYNVLHGLVTGFEGSLSAPIQAIVKGNRVYFITQSVGIPTPVNNRGIVSARVESTGGGGMGSAYIASEPMTLVFQVAAGSTVTLPILGDNTLTVSWGDASSNVYSGFVPMTHTYSGSSRKVVVTIDGPVTMFGTQANWAGINALTDVSGWGTAGTLFSLAQAFKGSSSLVTVPSSIPDTVQLTSNMFENTTIFNDPNVTQWDMSKVTNVSNMFRRAAAFKQDLYSWDISSTAAKTNFFTANTGIPNGAFDVDATLFNPYSPFAAPPSGRNPNLTEGLGTDGLTGKFYGTHGSAIFEYDISMNKYSLITTTHDNSGNAVTPSSYSNVVQLFDETSNIKLLTGLDTPELLTYSLGTGEQTVIPLDASCGSYMSQIIAYGGVVYFTTYNETDNKAKLVKFDSIGSVFTVSDLSAQVNEGAGALTYSTYSDVYYVPTQFGSIYKFTPPSTITKLVDISSTMGYSLPASLKLTVDSAGNLWGATLYDGPGSTIVTRGGYVFRCDKNGQNFTRFDVSSGYCTDMGAQNLLVVDNGYVYGASAAYNPIGPTEPGNVGYIPGYVYRMTTNGDGFTKLWNIPDGQTVQSIHGRRNNDGLLESLLIQPVSTEYHLNMISNSDMIPAVVIPTTPPPAPPNENYTKLINFPAGSEPKGFIDICGYLYGTTTTGLFRLRLSDSSYNSLQAITGCAGQLYRIGNVIYGLTGASLFSYNTGLGQNPFQIVKDFSPSTPNPNMTLDAAGNLYITDSSGGLWRASYPTGAVTYLTNTSPKFHQGSAISADGGYVWGVTNIGNAPSFGNPDNQAFIKVSTSPPYTQTTVATVDINSIDITSLVVDSGHHYLRSLGDTRVISKDANYNLHVFDGGLNGSSPSGPLLIDRINKRLYGICGVGGGGIDGVGTNSGGCLYSVDISNNAFNRIIDYVTGDPIRGSTPTWLSITPETGQAYVVTTTIGGTFQTLVAIRAPGGSNSTIGSGNLPGYAPQCFNKGTKILTGETWTPIENLRVGDLVTTYSHGLRSITHIGKGQMINNPDVWHTCMYRSQRKGFDPLLVTGGHAFLVDYLSESQQRAQADFWGSDEVVIDDKILMIAPVSEEFEKITDRSVYIYYHFVVENDGDDDRRYGVYANGFLTETPSKNQFLLHKYS